MKALITIAALTISFSAYAEHKAGHKGAMKPTPTAATAPATTTVDPKVKMECEKMHKNNPAEIDACIASKAKPAADHM